MYSETFPHSPEGGRVSTHIQVVPLLAVLLILAPIFGHVGHLQSQEALHAGLVTVQREKKMSGW